MMTLGGTVCVRNGESLDYCWQETVKSLLPVCEQVVICDGESTDGTWEKAMDMATQNSKIALCRYAWPDPKGDIDFLVKWLNYAREHLRTDFNFSLDADEVVSEESYQEIMDFKGRAHPKAAVSLRCRRHNFWRDLKTTIPPGHCLSHEVVRIGPQWVFMPSDGAHPNGEEIVSMSRESGIEIFHYGFLRKREAYFEKSRQLHTMFFGAMSDQRLVEAEKAPGNWMEKIKDVGWTNALVHFEGSQPLVMTKWLNERGWL